MLVLAWLLLPGHASAAFRECSFPNGPLKPHVRDLTANGATCVTARKVASEVREHWRFVGDASDGHALWRCHYSWVGIGSKFWLVTCRRGARYVSARYTGVGGP